MLQLVSRTVQFQGGITHLSYFRTTPCQLVPKKIQFREEKKGQVQTYFEFT